MRTLETERVRIEAHSRHLRTGIQLIFNLFGSSAPLYPELVAVCTGPLGEFEIAGEAFIQHSKAPLELLSGLDREEGMKALARMTSLLTAHGYETMNESGAFWFQLRFWRPYLNLGELLQDDELQELAAQFAKESGNLHALSVRAYLMKLAADANEGLSVLYISAYQDASKVLSRSPNNLFALCVQAEAGLAMNYMTAQEALSNVRRALEIGDFQLASDLESKWTNR